MSDTVNILICMEYTCQRNVPEVGSSVADRHMQCSVFSTLCSRVSMEAWEETSLASNTSSSTRNCFQPKTSKTKRPIDIHTCKWYGNDE